MLWTVRCCSRARLAALSLLFLAAGSTGCGDLLEVDDPTEILESEVNDAQGAELLRRGALKVLYAAASPAAWSGGLMADEFLYHPRPGGFPVGFDLLDARSTVDYYNARQFYAQDYGLWQRLRLSEGRLALAKLQAYAAPGAREAHVGEMFAVRAYAAMRLAETFCPGFPLHDVVNYRVVYSPPRSTEQAFEYALAEFDSAMTWTATDSARVLNFARVGRARTLLNLGRFADAAGAVTGVPTDYSYSAEHAEPAPLNFLAPGGEFSLNWWGVEIGVADREGGNGLNFVSAADPRVQLDSLGMAADEVTILYSVAKYPSATSPLVLASGIEARLIEAEAALQGGGDWLGILNTLRTTSGGVDGLPPLTDPGTAAARLDLLFRERAFWLFATGSRLGDLRRLVRVYGRDSEDVFPTGAYWQGGVYSTGTSIPFDRSEVENSPGITGCTSW